MADIRFTTAAAVRAKLPRDYNTNDLPYDDDSVFESLDTLIVTVSNAIMSRLGSIYVAFNSANHATFPTPGVVKDICTNWVIGEATGRVMVGDKNGEMGQLATDAIALAHARLDAILDDDAPDSIPLETVTSETLSFPATHTTRGLNTTEAFVNVQANLTLGEMPTVVDDSVVVTRSGYTDYRPGVDFGIRYAPEYRRHVFTDAAGFLHTLSDVTIRYQFDYRRATKGPAVATATRTGLLGGF